MVKMLNISNPLFEISITPKDDYKNIMGPVSNAYHMPVVSFFVMPADYPEVRYDIDSQKDKYIKAAGVKEYTFTYRQLQELESEHISKMIKTEMGNENLVAAHELYSFNYLRINLEKHIHDEISSKSYNPRYDVKGFVDMPGAAAHNVDPVIRLYMTQNKELSFYLPEKPSKVIMGEIFVGGYYSPSSKEMVSNNKDDFRVIFHELGHSIVNKYPDVIDKNFGKLVFKEISEYPLLASAVYLGSESAKKLYKTDKAKIEEIFVELFANYSILSANKDLSSQDIESKLSKAYPNTAPYFLNNLLPMVHANILVDYFDEAKKAFNINVGNANPFNEDAKTNLLKFDSVSLNSHDVNLSFAIKKHATDAIYRLARRINGDAYILEDVDKVYSREDFLIKLNPSEFERVQKFAQTLIHGSNFDNDSISIYKSDYTSKNEVSDSVGTHPLGIKINTSKFGMEDKHSLLLSLIVNNVEFHNSAEKDGITIPNALDFIKASMYDVRSNNTYKFFDSLELGRESNGGYSELLVKDADGKLGAVHKAISDKKEFFKLRETIEKLHISTDMHNENGISGLVISNDHFRTFAANLERLAILKDVVSPGKKVTAETPAVSLSSPKENIVS